MMPVRISLATVVAVVWLSAGPVHAAVQPGTYLWPVRGPVIRGYEAPTSPYSAGHRGIDIAAPFGSPMVAAQEGTIAFAGWVAGALFLSIDHPDGVRTTYSWISAILVKKGDRVARGQLVGNTGRGHPEVPTPHLHFGARIGQTYLDPMTLLEAGSVAGLIHLAPLADPGQPGTFQPLASPAFAPSTGPVRNHAV